MIACEKMSACSMNSGQPYFHTILVAWLCLSIYLNIGTSVAADISATSCSRADVGDAVNRANNGDTILIPSGRCTWTTNLAINQKYLTLKGAGIDKTIIVDGVSKATYPNIPQMLTWAIVDTGLSRITGITFQGGTNVDTYNKGIIELKGSSHSLRIDHNKFIPTQTAAMYLYGDIWGVVDHNTFDMSAQKGYGIYVLGHEYGDAAWAADSTIGTDQALFIEDNRFTQDRSKGFYYPAIDGWAGHRVVIRHNEFNAVKILNHGTESGQRWRSARQYEIYNNTWIWDMYSPATPTVKKNAYPALVTIRGGTGVIFNNTATITNGSVYNFVEFKHFRHFQSSNPWGLCPSDWDLDATRCMDQAGVGKGRLLSGQKPMPHGWPQQVDDPAYLWNNRINGTLSHAISTEPTVVQANRDFFDSEKQGYVPYAYPHPLTRATPDASQPRSPSDLSVR